MSVCAKFQLSSWSRSGWKVGGGGWDGWGGLDGWVEHVTTVSNSNASCFRVVLSWVELRWVLTIYVLRDFTVSSTRQFQNKQLMI